ncbi:MAG: tripartite tricarboxylate transporter TctB family protein [Beijerinckiaceae bacterium]
MAAPGQGEGAHARLPLGETLIALGVIGLAAVVFWQTLAIPVSPLYARVGPTVIPMIAAAGLAGCGVVLLIEALRGGWQDQEEREAKQDKRALALLLAGFLANISLIGPAGFTIASTILFTLTALAFGSKNVLRDAGTGFALSLVAYLGFARALGINIGAGPLERMIERIISVIA